MVTSPLSQEAITHYVNDLSKWEEWQREYKFGALYLFPPSPLLEEVNALRATYDPLSHAYCDAHISLTVPLSRSVNRQDWIELAEIANRIAPFTVTYGPPRTYPGSPGVVLHIEPFERFNQLVLALESAEAFAGTKQRKYPFSPHMTIAEFITFETSEKLLQELPREELAGTFECHTIAYAVPDADFHFAERAFLALRG